MEKNEALKRLKEMRKNARCDEEYEEIGWIIHEIEIEFKSVEDVLNEYSFKIK